MSKIRNTFIHCSGEIMMKKIVSIVIFLFLLNIPAVITTAMVDLAPNAKSAILIELDSGQILFEKDAEKALAPASMTKIMSLKIIFDSIKEGRIGLDSIITTSEYAASMGGSQIFLKVGEQMPLSDLLKAITIASANDAAVAVAEAICGNEESFVSRMNKEAKTLKLKNTNFVNVTGLPESNHYTCAYDMATMAQALLNRHGTEVLTLTNTYEDYLRQDTDSPFWLVNTNKLVKHVKEIDGLKTGWTNEAGYCVTTTMQKADMRLITVVMGCASPDVRTKDTLSMLNYGFANYDRSEIVPKGTVVKELELVLNSPQKVDVVLNKAIVVVLPKGEIPPEYTYRQNIDEDKIKNGEKDNIGTYQIIFNNKVVGESSLSLTHSIKRADFWTVLWSVIKAMLT